MRDIIGQLVNALSRGGDVAYCRLVETRGSTPQKAGAGMLVYPDGSQAGTLGGGCVEAETKRRALAVLGNGQPVVARFELDHDYGWDDGLICGGRMLVGIWPLPGGVVPDYLQLLSDRLSCGAAVTEAVVYDARTSGLPETATFLFDDRDQFVRGWGAPGDEAAIASVAAKIRPLASRPRPYAAAGIAYLPSLARCRLLIVGGGHIGKAVGDLAADLDFEVWAVDDREQYVSVDRFPKATRRVVGEIDRVLPQLEITADTYCIIVTRGHVHDQEALYRLVDRGARYVGMIGSRRKIRLIYDNLLSAGVSEESLARVHAPLGIDIGSQTVAEIAVSICAELVSHRNRNGQVPGRESAS